MENLYWELHVLSRCVAYKNLSGASSHVGLSQPQLSRIIGKLESELNIVLLDRGAKRKSSWTPAALRLAEAFSKSRHQLEHDIQKLNLDAEPKHLRVASLEGLGVLAAEYCQHLYDFPKMQVVELDIHDTSALEEQFFKGNYDLIFTSREPGRKKFKYVLELGRQTLDEIETNKDTRVLSSYQFHAQHKTDREESKSIFVSNSLEIRKLWVQKYGGVGLFPSPIKRGASRDETERVLLIADSQMNPKVWERIVEFHSKLKP